MLTINPDETVILAARKHWLLFALEALGTVVAIALALALITVGPSLLPAEVFDAIGGENILALCFIFAALTAAAGTIVFSVALTNFYLDILIVTDKRIIDCEQKSIFSRDIATVPSANVIDVKVEISGILQTFFTYGTLYVQTAGATKEIIVHGIRDPHGTKDTIIATFLAGKTEVK